MDERERQEVRREPGPRSTTGWVPALVMSLVLVGCSGTRFCMDMASTLPALEEHEEAVTPVGVKLTLPFSLSHRSCDEIRGRVGAARRTYLRMESESGNGFDIDHQSYVLLNLTCALETCQGTPGLAQALRDEIRCVEVLRGQLDGSCEQFARTDAELDRCSSQAARQLLGRAESSLRSAHEALAQAVSSCESGRRALGRGDLALAAIALTSIRMAREDFDASLAPAPGLLSEAQVSAYLLPQ